MTLTGAGAGSDVLEPGELRRDHTRVGAPRGLWARKGRASDRAAVPTTRGWPRTAADSLSRLPAGIDYEPADRMPARGRESERVALLPSRRSFLC